MTVHSGLSRRALLGAAAGAGIAAATGGALLAGRPAAAASRTDLIGYLNGLRGNHTVSGQHNAEPNSQPTQYTDQVYAITGVYPGLWGGDFLYEADSIAARQTMIDAAVAQWNAGTLVTLMWHEAPPTMDEPCSWDDIQTPLTADQWNELVTDGSDLNGRWKSELDIIVPYLQQLKSAGIPVLWRPLHEINDGWSWWGGTPQTAELWRITYEHLVTDSGLDNLVWVWSVKDSDTDLATYYPGDDYVDVLALDPWVNGTATGDWYQRLLSMAGDRPVALAEVGPLPTPDALDGQPQWTYFNCWADYLTSANSNDAVKATYYDTRVLHRGDIDLG
jgi:mannan endo-1,4-beta-mannosidase